MRYPDGSLKAKVWPESLARKIEAARTKAAATMHRNAKWKRGA